MSRLNEGTAVESPLPTIAPAKMAIANVIVGHSIPAGVANPEVASSLQH